MLREVLPNGAADVVARRFGITGGAHATVAACATGTLAIIQAARWIQEGEADIVLAGSSDASLTPLWLGAFRRMGVLAEPHPTLGPAYACRPFDRTRHGFTLGEGRRRPRPGKPKFRGPAGRSTHGTNCRFRRRGGPRRPDPDHSGCRSLATVLRLALQRGGIQPENLVAVMAHGTATQANDAAEAQALSRCWATGLPRSLSCRSKAGLATSSVRPARSRPPFRPSPFLITAMPGNSTLIESDPALGNLNLPRSAIEFPEGPILKVSMGFGGHLAAIAPRSDTDALWIRLARWDCDPVCKPSHELSNNRHLRTCVGLPDNERNITYIMGR